MKIIQPPRYKGKRNTSRNDSRSLDRSQGLVYQPVDVEVLAQSGESKFRKNRTNRKKVKPRKNQNKSLVPQPPTEELFDFNTSNLEAMPKEQVATPKINGKKRRRSELISEKASEPIELVTDPAKKEFNDLFSKGIRLLSMREHSVKELTNKLLSKSDNVDVIHAVVDDLLEKKYLSEQRFTESYIRARSNRGFGPSKIKAELKNKGINSSLIHDHLDEGAAIWFDNAKSQYQKKYGDTPISDYSAWTKRARFMQGRGFTMEHIECVVRRHTDW